MGTNFYLKERGPCLACHQKRRPLHIGKSSAGWCFSLHVYPNDADYDDSSSLQPENLEDWKALFADRRYFIEDEYGDKVSMVDMLVRICERSWGKGSPDARRPIGYSSWDDFYQSNHAEPGPNGLSRHKIEHGRCIGHGDGTYDLIVGDFS